MKSNENKSIFSQHNCCLEAVGDPKIVKYLYDKELERSKLIVEKTTAAFILFTVNSGFLAINRKDLFQSGVSSFFSAVTLFFIVVTALILIASFGFSTKINGSHTKRNNNYNIDEMYCYLHEMNNKKEVFLDAAYFSLAVSICFFIILKTCI